MGELLRDGLRFLTTLSRSRAALVAEILFLRKQLAYYQTIRSDHADSATPPGCAGCFGLACSIGRQRSWPKTNTFIRWHRKGFKWYWPWKSRGGRPPLPKEIRQLIARMVRENVTWGEERIRG
jgi:putative transposase